MIKRGTVRILLFSFLALFITGCTAAKTGERTLGKTKAPVIRGETLKIVPLRSNEECIELFPGNIMEYSFRASKPVKFNIHYHAEDRIHYPVLKEDVAEWSGVLDVGTISYYTKEQEYFCLMWENPHSESVSVTYEYRVSHELRH